MKATRSLGRPILLLALFALPVLVILHIGHSLTPQKVGPDAVSPPAITEMARVKEE